MKFGRVVILGATGGIGKAVSRAILRDATELILIGRNPIKCQKLSREFAAFRQVKVVALDILDTKACAEMLVKSRADLVINCIGIGKLEQAINTDPSFQKELWEINYFTPIRIAKELLRLQREWQKPIVFVQLGSLATFYPHPYLAEYSASKTALWQYYLAFSEELRQDKSNFFLYYYVPGPVQTKFFPPEIQTKLGGRELQMSAPEVGREIVRQIYRRKSYAVIGKRYRLMQTILAILPRGFVLKSMATYLKKGL